MQFVPAKWFHAGRLKAVRLIVIHCTVSAEMGTGAEAVAAYFKKGDRRASAHRVVDNNSTVQCVKDEDTAFGAAGANSDGIHLELVGQPTQTQAQWLDDYSRAELMQAGLTVREWSRDFTVPLRWLTVAEVADGKSKGLCTHWDVSRAFPDVSTGHWDPGEGFPKDEALRIWTPQPEPKPPTPHHLEEPMLYVRQKNPKDRILSDQFGLVAVGEQVDTDARTPLMLCGETFWNWLAHRPNLVRL